MLVKAHFSEFDWSCQLLPPRDYISRFFYQHHLRLSPSPGLHQGGQAGAAALELCYSRWSSDQHHQHYVEMQILGFDPWDLLNQHLWLGGPSNLDFNKLSPWFSCSLKFEHHWPQAQERDLWVPPSDTSSQLPSLLCSFSVTFPETG